MPMRVESHLVQHQQLNDVCKELNRKTGGVFANEMVKRCCRVSVTSEQLPGTLVTQAVALPLRSPQKCPAPGVLVF